MLIPNPYNLACLCKIKDETANHSFMVSITVNKLLSS